MRISALCSESPPRSALRAPRSALRAPRKGVVLLAVMVVVAIMSLMAYRFVDLASTEYKATQQAVELAQARAAADAGVHYVAALMAKQENIQLRLSGNPYSNFEKFAGQQVRNLPGASFTIIAPPDPGEGGMLRFGVSDEASRINPNALMLHDPFGETLYRALLKLPGMTEPIASAIVDWLDSDNDPRQTGGVENDHYANKGYRARNGPIQTIEELLLVEGVTPQLLFGGDFNRNGIIDADEDYDAGLGWAQYLTVWSRELNIDNMNIGLRDIMDSKSFATVYDAIAAATSEDLAKFIALYRKNGSVSETGTSQSTAASFAAMLGVKQKAPQGMELGNLADLTREDVSVDKPGSNKIKSIFDLVGAQTKREVTDKSDPKNPKKITYIYFSPLNDTNLITDLLPKLLNVVYAWPTSSSGLQTQGMYEMPARINVMTAPEEVLAVLPALKTGADGFTDADVQAIIANRPTLSMAMADPEYQSLAWLFTKAGLSYKKLRELERYITFRSQVFRVQVIGTVGRTSARVEAVIDTNAGRPRIVYYRDLTEAGAGMPQI